MVYLTNQMTLPFKVASTQDVVILTVSPYIGGGSPLPSARVGGSADEVIGSEDWEPKACPVDGAGFPLSGRRLRASPVNEDAWPAKKK